MDRTPPLVSIVPGYKGYRDKENRRDSDKRIREHIAARLDQIARRVERVAAELADRRELMAVSSVANTAKAIRHLQNQIATATYGYGGLWSDRDVDGAALDQIAQFDQDLLNQVEELTGPVTNLENAVDLTSREAATDAIRQAVDNLQGKIDERATVVETGQVSAPSNATSPLGSTESESTKPLPPAAFSLGMGDALTIRGQQAVVNAMIDVTGDQPMKLLRIGINPARWLIVNERFIADTTAGEITQDAGGAVANGEKLTAHGGGSGMATLTGLGTPPDQKAITFQVFAGSGASGAFALRLAWASAELSLVGRGVPTDDVELVAQKA